MNEKDCLLFQVLITKLRTSMKARNQVNPDKASSELEQSRKAAKALLVLIPLLGVTYMLTILLPTQGIVAVTLQYLRDILLSIQVSELFSK